MSEIIINDLKINYEQKGDKGKDVILLHGWGQNLQMMDPIAEYLKNYFRVYNIDLPNFGKSDPLKEVYGVPEYTDVIRKFVVKLGIENPIIIAHSFGCRIAFHYAHDYPVYKMVLTGAAGIREKADGLSTLRQSVYKFSKKVLLNLHQEELLKKLQDKMGSEDYRNASGVLRQSFVKIVNDDVSDFLKDIKCEVLLVHGENDEAVPLSSAKKMEQLLPNCGLAIFENDDHFAYFHQAYRFNQVLYAFLKEDFYVE